MRFGGVEKTKDESREARRARAARNDRSRTFATALRSLRKNPGYAAAAILTLALGIGANTAIFSVVHGVLLQSLPYGGGDRLVRLRVDAPGAGIEDGRVLGRPSRATCRRARAAFPDVVEYHSMWFVLLGQPEPERVQTGVVSASFFDLLGVRPILGRTFLPGEDKHGAEAVLVLSHDYWMRGFGGDPSVVGRVFQMNDRPHTVVGVLPPIPGYPEDNDVYMPISACPFRSDPSHGERPGRRHDAGVRPPEARASALGDAQRDLGELAAQLEADYPKSYPKTIRLGLSPVPLSEELTRSARPTFLMLFGTVGARAADRLRQRRQPDAGAPDPARSRRWRCGRRSAPGRARLARQLLTESDAARARGRRPRPRRRGGGPEDAGPLRRALHAAGGRDRDQRSRAPLLARRVARRRDRASV